jgi:D-tyrosyl-tRNA(Tyr) deacylase
VEARTVGQIQRGILVFVGVGKEDAGKDAEYLADKIIHLRIFEDAQGKMNLSCLDVKGEILVVSQFTLYGDCAKGCRPSFNGAAAAHTGEGLYDDFIQRLRAYALKVETGRFRAMMDVSLTNDGPVTLILDSCKK